MLKYLLYTIALILGLNIMAYAGMKLIQVEQSNQGAAQAYGDLRAMIAHGMADDEHSNDSEPLEIPLGEGRAVTLARGPLADIPPSPIDFDLLKEVNTDALAWLYSPGTVIDYPVMRADDYDYYLRHLPDGRANKNGSLFVDFNNAPDFGDSLTVIYGHNMKTGQMFGGLTKYKSQKYYDEHPYMYLYTEDGGYRIDLLYGCLIAEGKWREQGFMFAANSEALLSYAAYNSTFDSETVYREGDRIIALSTCSYEFDDARYVVLGVLRKENL